MGTEMTKKHRENPPKKMHVTGLCPDRSSDLFVRSAARSLAIVYDFYVDNSFMMDGDDEELAQ